MPGVPRVTGSYVQILNCERDSIPPSLVPTRRRFAPVDQNTFSVDDSRCHSWVDSEELGRRYPQRDAGTESQSCEQVGSIPNEPVDPRGVPEPPGTSHCDLSRRAQVGPCGHDTAGRCADAMAGHHGYARHHEMVSVAASDFSHRSASRQESARPALRLWNQDPGATEAFS